MTKEEALTMSKIEWETTLDCYYLERLQYQVDINGFDLQDKNACWLAFEKTYSKEEEHWTLKEDPSVVNSNHRANLEDEWEEEQYLKDLEYHHEKVTIPYWKVCTDNIIKLLAKGN